MSEVTAPACAYSVALDALESLDHEHRDCSRVPREAVLTFVCDDDGRAVTVFSDRPRCLRREVLMQPWHRVTEGAHVPVGYG